MNKRDKENVLDYLKKRRLMSIATYSDKPWIATVYYVTDDDLNLYFLSDPTSQHARDFVKNNKVACAIFDSDQKATDKKVGIQLWGEVSAIKSLEKINWMLKIWHEVNPGLEDVLTLESMKKRVINAKVYKVLPKKIKFFNEKLYGPEGVKVFQL